jgi:putative transposase
MDNLFLGICHPQKRAADYVGLSRVARLSKGVAKFPGTGGRFRQESVAGINRNQWPLSIGMGGRFGPEYSDANLAKGMRQLNGVYTQRFNRTYDRVGHVFEGRYKAILVQKDSYLLELARYVVLNPVRARMVRAPEDWPWSSYRAMISAPAVPEWLETRAILAAFGETESDAVAHYVRFVRDGKGQPSPWEQLKHQVFLGSDAFVESMRRKLPQGRDLREVPQAKARPRAKPLADYASRYPERDQAIVAAYASGGYTMQDIGDFFGLHYSRVSKIVRASSHWVAKEKGKTWPHL